MSGRLISSSDLTDGDNGKSAGTLDVTTTRDYEISGYVDTSDGRITTDLTQHIAFSNAQIFDIVGSATYRQRLQQSTEIDTTTTVNTGVYSHVLTEHVDWPLAVDYAFDVASDGSAAQVTSIDQGLQRDMRYRHRQLYAV